MEGWIICGKREANHNGAPIASSLIAPEQTNLIAMGLLVARLIASSGGESVDVVSGCTNKIPNVAPFMAFFGSKSEFKLYIQFSNAITSNLEEFKETAEVLFAAMDILGRSELS